MVVWVAVTHFSLITFFLLSKFDDEPEGGVMEGEFFYVRRVKIVLIEFVGSEVTDEGAGIVNECDE